MIKRFLGTLVAGGFMLVLLTQVVSAARVNFTPSSVSLTEGQSQVVQVTLDEPIICSDPAPPCQVSLAISTNAPDRVTIDTSPVVISNDLWFQTFSFTVSAVDDLLENGDITPIDAIVNTSGSEYYNGFIPTFSISILDNDVTPPSAVTTSSSTVVQNQPTLANTGQNQQKYLIFTTFLLVLPVLHFFRQKRSRSKN